MEKLTKEEVLHVAKLARLKLNEDEIESIINYFNKRKSEMLLLNRELNKSLKLKKHS